MPETRTSLITPSSQESSEVAELRQQLAEAQQALEAIRTGQVDALLVHGPDGPRIFSLQGAERPYRLLVERMQQGAATVAEDGTILYCNARLSEMLGAPYARVIGSRLIDYIVPGALAGVASFLRDGSVRPARTETALRKPNDGQLPVRIEASPLPPEFSGCMWVIITDLTEEHRTIELLLAKEALRASEERLQAALGEIKLHRDQLEEQVAERTTALKDTHERLRHSERVAALGTLAAGLGHDVSNTILPLRVRLEALQSAPELSADSRDNVQAIHMFAEYLASLARGLRMFARDPDHDDGDAATDVAGWCTDVSRFLASSTDQNIEFSFSVAPGLPPAKVAAHRLTQAVLNLVNNSRDAIRAARGPGAPGRISVSAVADPVTDGVVIAVADDGCGMSDPVRSRCLEPFFTTKARGSGGTGLGLSMVFGIVGASGGRVDVQSNQGAGTQIKLFFPPAHPALREAKPHRRSFVTLQDQRMSGVVTSMLRTLERDVVPGSPGPGPQADLWVTDPSNATPDEARSFLAAGPERRVIVLGGDDTWTKAGARVHPTRPATDALRRDLADA